MALSERARQARNEYYRRRYHERQQTRKGKEAFEATQERYWLKKAELFEAEAKRKKQ